MTNLRQELTLGEVQAKVRADHIRIRGILDNLAELARSALGAGGKGFASKPFADAIWTLFLAFDDHLAMEESELIPLVERTGLWGKVPIERMHDEHRQQRIVLLAMVDECDSETKSPSQIADDTRWLVNSLRRDMDREEREFETIRDDGFVADQATG